MCLGLLKPCSRQQQVFMILFGGSHLSISEKQQCDSIALSILWRFLAEFSHLLSILFLFSSQFQFMYFLNSPGNNFTPSVKIFSISQEFSIRMINELCIQTQ